MIRATPRRYANLPARVKGFAVAVVFWGFWDRANGQSGIITTIAGNGTPGFSDDGGNATFALAADAFGNVRVADSGNNFLRRRRTGNFGARVEFAGLVPGFTWLYQVNVAVPAGVHGNALPVVLTAGDQPSPVVTMAVQ